MRSAALRPWLTTERVATPAPERNRVEIKWWDRACYAAIDPLRRLFIARSIRRSDIAALVDQHGGALTDIDDAALRMKADALRRRLVSNGFTPDLVAQTFALVREATGRKLRMRHRPVQLLGGLAMLHGRIAEMRTGEGKTITALLPAVTAALAGMPVHVVTVNDYLAQRDAELLRPVFEVLGLSVGLAVHGQPRQERRQAYGCDVIYACNKELVFDYLRDRTAFGRPSAARLRAQRLSRTSDEDVPLMRGLHFAIVDEADSVLIDEARTPLIISRQHEAEMDADLCNTLLRAAGALVQDADYEVSTARRSVHLRDAGRDKVKLMLADLPGHWKAKRAREELVGQALSAQLLYERNQHYIVVDDKIQIVDEFTGRTMADRQWQRGLQQLIEAKEGCAVSGRRETLSQITYQRFFRRYIWLCGMTGTGMEVSRELESVYGLSVVTVPTHRPDLKRDLGARIHRSSGEKWADILAATRDAVRDGRPVLVGTRSVEASEHLAKLFAQAGLAHVVLNARNEEAEAELVAAAGTPSRITIATNMAGRGTDISLAPEVVKAGGLHVILTEFHESGRIDRQLYGRCGRQGDPGSYQAIVALDDHLFAVHAKRLAKAAAASRVAAPVLGLHAGRILKLVAQHSAESLHAGIRRQTLKRDRELEKSLAFSTRSSA